MKEPKIYKSIWQVVVLSGEPVVKGTSFEEIVYQIDEGDCLGSYSVLEQQEIEGTEAIIEACEEVGNDGSFFTFLLGEQKATARRRPRC
jgi:hypothetical protein